MPGDLSELWWESSTDYRESPHWLVAHTNFRKGDNRVLLLGPGSRNSLFEVTTDLKTFLDRVGFQAATLDGDFDPHEHRAQAADFPRIVALPVTVGSCSEVLDFAANDDLRRRLAVVLPREHHGGYFARIVRDDHKLRIRECGTVESGQSIDAELGKMCLMELAARESRASLSAEAASITAATKGPENVQAREAEVATSAAAGPVPSPGHALSALVVGSGLVVVAAVVGLALDGLPLATVGVVGAILLAVFFGLQPFLLRQVGLISEANFVKMFSEVVRQISSFTGSARPDRPEPPSLPEGAAPPAELPPGEAPTPPPDQEA